MAERRPASATDRHQNGPEQDREQPGAATGAGRGRDTRPRPGRVTAPEVAKAAVSQIAQLTGREPESVTGIEPAEDGWVVGVEVVEDHRVPSSADILATYEVECDADGQLISYRRIKRYARGRGDSGDS
jgi:hypothetical protein